MDLATPTPEVTIAAGSRGRRPASWADGVPIRAVIIQSEPLSAKNASGVPLYAFVLTILQDGPRPGRPRWGDPVTTTVPLSLPGVQPPGQGVGRRPQGGGHRLGGGPGRVVQGVGAASRAGGVSARSARSLRASGTPPGYPSTVK